MFISTPKRKKKEVKVVNKPVVEVKVEEPVVAEVKEEKPIVTKRKAPTKEKTIKEKAEWLLED